MELRAPRTFNAGVTLRDDMNFKCNNNLIEVMKIAQQMMDLADQGDDDRQDAGCGVLYGTLRDSAYKLKDLAKSEINQHKVKGKWESTSV